MPQFSQPQLQSSQPQQQQQQPPPPPLQQQQTQQQQPQLQQPLQEINQEDLAAILPDEDHEDAPFDGFEDSESGRLVSKAIERMSLGADSDSGENTDQIPVPVYSSTLLQQFVEKTALLSEPRKRRNKLVKKLNESEYACVSNVSPDSGIQSVDNSPLHLAISPVSPQAPTSQSPVQVASKPAVNVDRVLYPPKRKPGRPAKLVSTQPRGPGRPKLKPEIAAKIEKLEKNSNESQEKISIDPSCAKQTVQCKTLTNSLSESRDSSFNKKSKNKKSSPKNEPDEAKSKLAESEKVLPTRKKCLSKSNLEKQTKDTEQLNERLEKSKEQREKNKELREKSKEQRDKSSERTEIIKEQTEKSNERREKLKEQREISKEQKEKNKERKEKSKEQKEETNEPKEKNNEQRDKNKEKCNEQREKVKEQKEISKEQREKSREKINEHTEKIHKSEKNNERKEKNVEQRDKSIEQKEKNDKRLRRDKHISRKETAELPSEKQEKVILNRIPSEEKLPNNNKKSTKENRLDPTTSKKQIPVKKPVASISRRVLKENKSNKKTSANLETNVAVQTVISLPVTIPLQTEKLDFGRKYQKPETKNQSAHHHKHRHHKHCRKLVVPPKNPVRVDPFIVQELENLIEEFSKSCTLGRNNITSSSNHSELPQIFRVKKITKKRKGSEINSNDDQKLIKRRLKKEKMPSNVDSKSSTNSNSNSSSNEQRLPLKKRHYHVSSPHSSQSSAGSCNETITNSTESHIEEAIEATITRYGGDSSSSTTTTTQKVPVTPKKRHRDTEEPLPEKINTELNDTTPQIVTTSELNPRRKKKIVKDLRVTVTKLAPDTQIENKNSCEKGIKSTGEKAGKVEKAITEKIVKPEIAKPNLEVKIESVKKTETPTTIDKGVNLNLSTTNSNLKTGPTIVLKKKARRRKAINRTGFPTLKKKKKKKIVVEPMVKEVEIIPTIEETEVKIIDSVDDIQSEESLTKEIVSNQDTKTFEIVDPPPIREFSRHCFLDDDSCPTTMSLSKESSLECDGSRPCDKLCPVKFEKVQDSRIYDENATLEESLERYNMSQRVAVLNEENLRKLERSNSRETVKHELSCNNNYSHKRRRGSASPCNLTIRNLKRLKNAGYDTESDAMPSSDLASDDHDFGKQGNSIRGKRKQPRWKKRYLPAGLFSDYFKEDEPRKITNSDSGKNKMIYDPAEHPHGLLPPPYHCGKFLRQRKIPFQLPYDLWWLHTHSRLPGRDLVPSWNYRYVYYFLI